MHRSESSSQDHPDLSRVSSENVSTEQVNSDFIAQLLLGRSKVLVC